jgi:hypothetical protein
MVPQQAAIKEVTAAIAPLTLLPQRAAVVAVHLATAFRMD